MFGGCSSYEGNKIVSIKDNCFSTLDNKMLSLMLRRGQQKFCLQRFQTSISQLCCYNFNKLDNSKVVPLQAGNFNIFVFTQQIMYDPNHAYIKNLKAKSIFLGLKTQQTNLYYLIWQSFSRRTRLDFG